MTWKVDHMYGNTMDSNDITCNDINLVNTISVLHPGQ